MPERHPAPMLAGDLAARALGDCGGVLRPVPEFPDAPYRLAGDTLVWIGRDGPMHPRAIFADAAPRLAVGTPCPGRSFPPITAHRPDVCRAAFRRLLDAVAADAPASGFAPLLRGAAPAFPLDRREAEARAAAHAAWRGDGGAVIAPALRLLGAGPGLTPSGDDFVGALLFVRVHLGEPGDAWRDASATLRQAAVDRTHRIGAALFGDLADGHSFEALHALMAAAHAGAATGILVARAAAVTAIGHSSGWDMLAGLIAATAGLPVPRTTH